MTMAVVIALIALAAVAGVCVGWLIGVDQHNDGRKRR